MILHRHVLVTKERLRAEIQELAKSTWPGGLDDAGREVPANDLIRCVGIRGKDQGPAVLLECTYEG